MARDFGATDIVGKAGEDGAARTAKSPAGFAYPVIEAVGTQEAVIQFIGSTRPGGRVGYVGVSHGVRVSR